MKKAVFLRLKRKNSTAGFTLIEAMISASLLLIAVSGAMSQIVFQLRAEGTVNLNMQMHSLLHQITTRVQASPGDFPAYSSVSAQPISYIGCYNEAGSMLANKLGVTGFYGDFLASGDPTVQSDYCPNSVVEAHVTPYATGRAWVDLIVLPNTGRGFTVIRSTFRNDVEFELAL